MAVVNDLQPGRSDLLAPQSEAERAARFEREAIPAMDRLYGASLRMTGSPADAEDLVLDTMMTAYDGFGSMRAGTTLTTWLHRILNNTYITTYREKRCRTAAHLTDDVHERPRDRRPGHSWTCLRSGELDALESLEDKEIDSALQALPDDSRMAVHYADVEDFTYQEIAEIMGISVGAVVSLLHCGRRQLRDSFADLVYELPADRDAMERLLRIIVDISSNLDLDATLHRVVTAGMEAARAGHGALGVRSADGTTGSLVHAVSLPRAGTSPETPRWIGQALSLSGDREEPRATRKILALTIAIRNNTFGTLYLTDSRSGCGFTDADEIAARVVASAAETAIANSQLFDRATTTAMWIEAGNTITTAALSGADPHLQPLQLIADRACALTDAEQAIVLIPDSDLPVQQVDTLVVAGAFGRHTNEVIGQLVPVATSTTGDVFRSGRAVVTESFRGTIPAFTDTGRRPAIVVPLHCQNSVIGVVAVARGADRPAFDARDLELMSDFANHAAVGLNLAGARELTMHADRERIAHNLHDRVIQRVFAVGMDVQGTVARSHSPEVTDRLNQTLSDLQSIIEDIRTAIFGLQSAMTRPCSFRQRIEQAVADMTDTCCITTTVHISGPLTAVGDVVAEHAEAVIMEAISNAVRHSGATSLTVNVAADDELAIDIIDNGIGIPPGNRRHSGLANMRRRAEQVGGSCIIESPAAGGTHLQWTSPWLPGITAR